MQRPIATNQRRLPTVIETIADGMSLILVRPLLLLLPILVDGWYWLGRPVQPAGLSASLTRLAEEAKTSDDTVIRTLTDVATWDITKAAALFIPSLLSETSGHSVYRLVEHSPYPIESAGLGVGLLLALVAVATLLLAIFSVPIADAAMGRERSPGAVIRAMGLAWLRLSGLLLAILGAAIAVVIPVAIGYTLLAAVGIDLAALLGALAVIGGIAAFLLTWFAPDAIVVSEVGPLRALRLSYAVVRAHFWPTLGMVTASTVISIGLGDVWLRMIDSAPGLIIGIVGNAFVAVGLAMASMRFYLVRAHLMRPLGGQRPDGPSGVA